jgi:hypothetical protein
MFFPYSIDFPEETEMNRLGLFKSGWKSSPVPGILPTQIALLEIFYL